MDRPRGSVLRQTFWIASRSFSKSMSENAGGTKTTALLNTNTHQRQRTPGNNPRPTTDRGHPRLRTTDVSPCFRDLAQLDATAAVLLVRVARLRFCFLFLKIAMGIDETERRLCQQIRPQITSTAEHDDATSLATALVTVSHSHARKPLTFSSARMSRVCLPAPPPPPPRAAPLQGKPDNSHGRHNTGMRLRRTRVISQQPTAIEMFRHHANNCTTTPAMTRSQPLTTPPLSPNAPNHFPLLPIHTRGALPTYRIGNRPGEAEAVVVLLLVALAVTVRVSVCRSLLHDAHRHGVRGVLARGRTGVVFDLRRPTLRRLRSRRSRDSSAHRRRHILR